MATEMQVPVVYAGVNGLVSSHHLTLTCKC